MLETSKDLLYIVLAFCVMWLTIFSCWLLYYLAMMLKQAYDIAKAARKTVDQIDKLIGGLRNRVESSAGHLALLVEAVGELSNFLINKKSTTKPKSKKRS